ncbi:MAG: glycosyltransferase family 92 protein [Selenomonadaceae bacterium]|nr:glycosyltransferase family 92 protein [Selenomonadaceae bacterium]
MSVDKDLFLYDLAIVSIMKNAAPYVEEWLDYHLLAGVDHFFIYDNESEDNFKEILQPYIDAGLVTYIFYPGQRVMMAAFNEAIDKYKYLCRYIAFVDDDEFILPKNNRSISKVVDEILFNDMKAGGLEISWVFYGSSGQEKADYSHGVLERFKRRATKESRSAKSILNPRRVKYMWTTHFAVYQQGYGGLNQNKLEQFSDIPFRLTDKIVINHYHTKSWEEYCLKRKRGDGVVKTGDKYIDKTFKAHDLNDIFDEEILRYRKARSDEIILEGKSVLETFAEINRIDYNKIFKTLISNLFVPFERYNPKDFFDEKKNRYLYSSVVSQFIQDIPPMIFKDKLEKYLTCLSISTYLKKNFLGDEIGELFEEYSLLLIEKVLLNETSIADFQLLMQEMPRILALPYPVVYKIRRRCMEMIACYKESLQDSIDTTDKLPLWEEILRWDYHLKMLKVFDNYNHK